MSLQLSEFQPGQRWISETEPELGLALITRVANRRVTAAFKGAGEQREYALANAPLRRVRFGPGDAIRDSRGAAFRVESVSERNGLLYYRVAGRDLCETELSDSITFNEPQQRFFAGHFDPPELFDLRVAALQHRHRILQSRVRGFAGGRIDLIPHQLYIASEVSDRLAPRVLLADEVGLGKTIEACLILHRLLLTGRVERVLILVPETLVHQWFVELLRRFNVWFHIFDEQRCRDLERGDPDANPFLDDQLVLCSINMFSRNERRVDQVTAADWDLVIVDEAHHLKWSPDAVSSEYALVESLSCRSPGLLLLTATPEQLGLASHFARLRLLDPDRFYDLDEFIRETEHYRDVALLTEQQEDPASLEALLDQHGAGRVSFRNTRSAIAAVTGFPRRIAMLVPLEHGSSKHERIDWLAQLLRDLVPEKILLICRTEAMVVAIEASLRQRIKNLKAAVFHERLSLLQRDRNAAWFAEKDGAQILLCSEIGSEGRNFQFAHHLVLYDLPLDPELLEQRIGRLDRIGQKTEIQVHVPFVVGTGQEFLARWYHEGLNAFAENIQGGRDLLDRFGARIYELSRNPHKAGAHAELDRLIAETRQTHRDISKRLHEGRDRLLELNSFRPAVAARLVEQIRSQDRDTTLDEFMLRVFDQFMIPVEELAPRTYRLGSAGVLADAFPGLPADGMTITCDRNRALVREDIQFLTWDHPLVTGALDLLLGSEKGNSSITGSPDDAAEPVTLQAVFVLECVAPARLHIDRFLPPTPISVQLECSGEDIRDGVLRAESMAQRQVESIVDGARQAMSTQLDREIDRLKELRKVNRSIRPEEIELLEEQRHALDEHLNGSRLRLDGMRLFCRRS